MSRAKATDVSSPISLFPFIGVLLCTMGALLVVLIAVSPSAQAVAVRQTDRHSKTKTAIDNPETREQLSRVQKYVVDLERVRSEAEQRVRADQLRLSHLESHMRRLEDQVRSLQTAALELQELEKEHYDDREQAEREVGRLKQLIGQTRETIASLKAEHSQYKRSYALVPYDGPNGTFRRPIYLECRNDELVLQPEGIRFSRDDLKPPYTAGNPLASALRAAREHLLRLHPGEGQTRDTEPYPLLVMRPSGTSVFGPAQRAIRSGDFDFGYELVEEDWELKYPTPDPQLAVVAQQAIDLARARQKALAAAAPRAYHHPGLAAAGRFEFDEDTPLRFAEETGAEAGGDGGGDGMFGGADRGAGNGTGQAGGGSPSAVAQGAGTASSGAAGAAPGGIEGQAPGFLGQSHDATTNGVEAGANVPRSGAPGTLADGGPDGPGGPLPSGSYTPTTAGGPAGNGIQASAANQQAMREGGSTQVNAGGGSGSGDASGPPLPDGDYSKMQTELAQSRGSDWALRRKKPRAFPVRRTIPIIVRSNQLAIVAEGVQRNSPAATGKTIALPGDTVEAIDELVSAVHKHIDDWGMAGDGMYWRPVLLLHVGPDGERRAQDLARLLKNSGLEVQPAAAANVNSQGPSRATTR